MNKTAIEWTDYSSNPVRFVPAFGENSARGGDAAVAKYYPAACVKISPGCANCYAERPASTRMKHLGGAAFTAAEMSKRHAVLDEKELHRLLTARKLAGHKVFIGDMTDVFGEWVTDEMLDRLFAVFALRPDVTFQVLTKRAARMRAYFARPERAAIIDNEAVARHPLIRKCRKNGLGWHRQGYDGATGSMYVGFPVLRLPLPNVWLGVSVEDQARVDSRAPDLIHTSAVVRFLSIEPLLSAVDVEPFLFVDEMVRRCKRCGYFTNTNEENCPNDGSMLGRDTRVDWVICGGESGPKARPMHPEWVRSVRDQCEAAGVPFFFKQWGEWVPKSQHGEVWSGGWELMHADGSLFPSTTPWNGHDDVNGEAIMRRVGKKRAGAHIDGRMWRDMPAGKAVPV